MTSRSFCAWLRTLSMLALLSYTVSALADCPDDRRPDRPPLAHPGEATIGVQDFQVPSRSDGRMLDISLWYPAAEANGQSAVYQDALGSGPNDPARPVIPFEFCGQAQVDAVPAGSDQPLPTVLISHGFPGSRVLLAWLGEHLASHGFAVIGINHTDATHADRGEFADALINKPADVMAVLDAIEEGKVGLDGAVLNDDRVGLVGYSMGGYAALVAAGAGLNPALAALPQLADVELEPLLPTGHRADPRIAAVAALAPWGAPEALERAGLTGLSLWSAQEIASIKTPLLLVSGDADLVSGYEQGARWLFEQATSPRWLLTYHLARHNIAPMPPPRLSRDFPREFNHYAEPIWDIERLNDLNRHFVLAFFRANLQGQDTASDWLTTHHNGSPQPPGFGEREAIGFSIEQRGFD